MADERTDFDSPWKDILEAYFPEFMAFFFPAVHREIDWAQGYEMLDKELQQVAREAKLGKRLADKLVKVWTLAGEQVWVMVHIEVQSQREPGFAQRMYTYNYRLRDRFSRLVASFAVLSDDSPSWRPNRFQAELWGCRTTFQFPTVKLLDYGQDWAALEASDSPFAIVVMAHLKTLETRNDPAERGQWKLRLVKGLYQKGYDRQEIIDLLRFIDWLVNLPEALEQAFWQALLTYQEERRMKYVMSIERFAEARGRQRGAEEERRELILRQLSRKLGTLPDEPRSQISNLSSSQLEDLSEALLDFAALSDLNEWLSQLEAQQAEVLQQLADKFGQLDEAVGAQVQALSSSSLAELNEAAADFTAVDDLLDWLKARSRPKASNQDSTP